ncbi:phenylacetic acid degradation operon negative regulatory protein PaaX [Paremcibacter congregatus]|uniref:phenylacetic acid degradation operon negative regulatory protein PaaX n=1 Tax=Paremcibacter congregatus TaxID=2043170 RepID=UPI0030ED1129|tara:strand:+ start:7853 stop:8779 length:927 start_codon:yes stop_codon:yes gene_type:complete
MTISQQLDRLIHEFNQQQPLRAGSLIITVYGDLLAARGGAVWLGDVINLLEPLGINARHVRTAVSRLSKDNWISPHQVGRKSYYSLTDSGRKRFATATPQIYAGPRSGWDKRWTAIILPDIKDINKDLAAKELGWLGFGKVARSVLAHPMPDMKIVLKALDNLGMRDDVLLFTQSSDELTTGETLDALVHSCWNLEDLSLMYHAFLERYQPVQAALHAEDALTPRDALLIRLLMVHEYRKILLRDPRLPEELMPTGWEGDQAYHLCRDIYQLLLQTSESYLSNHMTTQDGPLPPPGEEFYERFNGLTP